MNKEISIKFKRLKYTLKRSKFLVAFVKVIKAGIEDCQRLKWIIIRSQTIKSYINSNQVRKLQLGAGSNLLKGWLNTDICPRSSESIYLDTTVSFPFDDCTFDYIFSEHHITTLSYNEGIFMLSECYRILKPGGRIRIAALNLEVLIGLYTSEKSGIQQQYIEWIIDKFLPEIKIYMESFVINNAFYNWEHKFIYDPPTLKNLMEKIGFIDVSFYSPGESKDENFQGVEYHGKSVGNEAMNRFETMVLEAKRPL